MKIRQFYIASEDTLTKGQKKKKEKYVKGMKKGAKDFKKRYGDDYKSVMYATATKMAKENTNESPIEQDRDNPIAKPYVDTPEWKALHDMDDKIIDAYIKHKEESVEEDQIPTDRSDFFIKRCVGLPGDTFQIKNKVCFVNGKFLRSVKDLQYTYRLRTDGTPLDMQFFNAHNIKTFNGKTK